jgi:endonuclease YncB( thermonuclease family)
MLRRLRSAYSTLAVVLFALAPSAFAETFEGAVVRVVDGDSLIVLRGQQQVRVRLKEIDAPERNQPFGKRSRQSLTDLCAKKKARVSWTEQDRNGRTLGRVWCGGIDANAEQIRRGMAWVFDRYVKDRTLYPLQDAARLQRLGLWCLTTLQYRLGIGEQRKGNWNTGYRSSSAICSAPVDTKISNLESSLARAVGPTYNSGLEDFTRA